MSCGKRHQCDGVGRAARKFVHFDKPWQDPLAVPRLHAQESWGYGRCPVCTRIVVVGPSGRYRHHMSPAPPENRGLARSFAEVVEWALRSWKVTVGGSGVTVYDRQWRVVERVRPVDVAMYEAQVRAFDAELARKYPASVWSAPA